MELKWAIYELEDSAGKHHFRNNKEKALSCEESIKIIKAAQKKLEEVKPSTSTNTQSTKCSHEMFAVVAYYKCSKCGVIEEPVDE